MRQPDLGSDTPLGPRSRYPVGEVLLPLHRHELGGDPCLGSGGDRAEFFEQPDLVDAAGTVLRLVQVTDGSNQPGQVIPGQKVRGLFAHTDDFKPRHRQHGRQISPLWTKESPSRVLWKPGTKCQPDMLGKPTTSFLVAAPFTQPARRSQPESGPATEAKFLVTAAEAETGARPTPAPDTESRRGRLVAVELLSVDEVAARLGVNVNRVQQHLRDGDLVAIAGSVPADFVQDGRVVKALPSVITLLRDARYADAEIVEWLFREDDSLPGRPIDALRADRGREVKRRAQAAGF